MADYTHKGIAISFNPESAVFTASLPGEKRLVRAPSLDAMKKRIDALARFESFEALTDVHPRYKKPGDVVVFTMPGEDGRQLVKRVIVGMEKGRYSQQFKDDKGETHGAVIPNTPEGIKAWREHEEARQRKREREAQLDAEVNDAQRKIPYIRASEYEGKT